jgi:phosphate transport system permease protein
MILAVARGVGESAPLLIVSGESKFLNVNPVNNPMNSLPLYIYRGIRSGQPLLITRAFGAASVLLVIVLLLFGITRVLARQRVNR